MRTERDKEKYTTTGRTENSYCGSSISHALSTLFLILISFASYAQENVTTVGIQYKPIFSNDFAGSGEQFVTSDNLEMTLSLERGSSYGLIIRKGLTKSLSFETGINSVTRRYRLEFNDLDSAFTRVQHFKYINYEIPVQGLIYIRLGEASWINTSLGMSINAYPSDVISSSERFAIETFRGKKFKFALVANIGYEYRTKKSGYFYFGTSFYNPLGRIGLTKGFYESAVGDRTIHMDVSGNYLTLDFRYFFHEKPEK